MDKEIKQENHMKYLGISISSNMTWSEHIEIISSKINPRPGLLIRIKHLLPRQARLLYYNSLVLPIFDYADIIWGDKNNTVIMNSLQILQNKAAKIILDRPLYSSASASLTELNWKTLKERRLYNRCLYLFKCKQGYINNHLSLVEKKDIHQHDTRNKSNVRLPLVKTNWGKQRLEYHAVKDWNNLNDETRLSNSILSFKNKFLLLSN